MLDPRKRVAGETNGGQVLLAVLRVPSQRMRVLVISLCIVVLRLPRGGRCERASNAARPDDSGQGSLRSSPRPWTIAENLFGLSSFRGVDCAEAAYADL